MTTLPTASLWTPRGISLRRLSRSLSRGSRGSRRWWRLGTLTVTWPPVRTEQKVGLQWMELSSSVGFPVTSVVMLFKYSRVLTLKTHKIWKHIEVNRIFGFCTLIFVKIKVWKLYVFFLFRSLQKILFKSFFPFQDWAALYHQELFRSNNKEIKKK